MGILKESNGRPRIALVTPPAAIPGGEFHIRGTGFGRSERPRVSFGNVPGNVVIGSDSLVVARVPEGVTAGKLIVESGEHSSQAWPCGIGQSIADSLHPVANPAVGPDGAVYSTMSGSRGQKTPVSVFRVTAKDGAKPLLTDLMNATGLAFDRDGLLYVSSRFDGIVYQATSRGEMSVYVEGMGVATGLAFDPEENLYVGDRSGTIFKISRTRQIYVYATIESSISAYHIAFGPDQHLYVTGPTTSSFDIVMRITPKGEVETFFRGVGRPQGLAFDADGNLYVAASLGGKRGIVRITPDSKAELFLSGPSIVGLAFAPGNSMVVATNNALYRVETDIRGRVLP